MLFAYEYGEPTADEQAHLEAINRARADPLNEAARLGIDLFEGVPPGEISDQPVQPLSFNALLLDAARSHSEDMLLRNFFNHVNPDGQSPFDRIMATGYIYRAAGENIALIGSTGLLNYQETALELHDNLFIDADYPNRGHRVNILIPDFREIGVGLASGDWQQNGKTFNAEIVTTDFAVRSGNNPILLGVVYQDSDNDQNYDAGEGLADIDIGILQTTDNTTTASAGGYGLEMQDGNYLLTFTRQGLGSLAKPVHIAEKNVKVDTLLSEFTLPTTDSQCATLRDMQLLTPCIAAGDNQFIADLVLSNPEPLTFTLQHIQKHTLAVTEQCTLYHPDTNIVHFPCVRVGEQSYWADLTLNAGQTLTITLIDFGLN